MSNNRSHERWNQLMSQLIDGTLSAEESTELSGIVASNPALQEQVVDQLILDSLMIEVLGNESITALVDTIGTDRNRIPVLQNEESVSAPAITRALGRNPMSWSTSGRFIGAIAALLLVAVMAGVFFSSPSQASAKTWITESRRIHQLAFDRCYVVEPTSTKSTSNSESESKRTDADTRKRSSILAKSVGRIDRIWTRGDQFYIESSNDKHRWVWGMDSTGSVWLTLDAKLGLKLEASEVPVWMETLADTLSMRVDTLLNEVLADYELTWEPSPTSSTTRIVKATSPRNRARRIREVQLEIDRETKVIHKISIVRLNRSDSLTTTNFTLAATEAQPDSRYRIEGHLDERSILLTSRNQPERRAELISRLFGQ